MRLDGTIFDGAEENPLPEKLEWSDGDDRIERPLSAYSYEEILAEMKLRFAAYVIVVQRTLDDDKSDYRVSYHGSWSAALGLAHYGAKQIGDS